MFAISKDFYNYGFLRHIVPLTIFKNFETSFYHPIPFFDIHLFLIVFQCSNLFLFLFLIFDYPLEK
jgi:hypothetical protein